MIFTRENINKLNPIEMDIYVWVTENPVELEKLKIRELAARLHVSTATILRFCKKFDCTGYVEFKIKLKESLEEQQQDEPTEGRNSSEKYFKFGTNNGAMTLEQRILEAVGLLNESSKIIFIGDGVSGVLAKYGALFFTTMGKSAHYIDSSVIPIPVEDHSKSVVIPLSVSGETVTLLDRLTGFIGLGAKVISITNGKHNSVARLADIALYYDIPKEETVVIGPRKSVMRTSGASSIPTLYLIERLAKSCVGDARHLV